MLTAVSRRHEAAPVCSWTSDAFDDLAGSSRFSIVEQDGTPAGFSFDATFSPDRVAEYSPSNDAGRTSLHATSADAIAAYFDFELRPRTNCDGYSTLHAAGRSSTP